MALYRLEAKMISRSAGRTATAAAAYRAGELIEDARTGLVFDFRARNYGTDGELKAANDREIMHTEILMPQHAPSRLKDRSKLWNEAELAERRKDAQTAREILLALPHELSQDGRIELVRRFVQEQFVDQYGVAADIAVHAPDKKGDQRNFHAHVLLTTRGITEDGFTAKKLREMNATNQLEAWREEWAKHQNRELEKRGHEKVDHRSYADQGSSKLPGVHLGPEASAMSRYGVESFLEASNDELGEVNKRRQDLRAEIRADLDEIEANIIHFEREKLNEWKTRKHARLQLDQEKQREAFEADLAEKLDFITAGIEAEFDDEKAGLSRKHDEATERLQASGWRKVLRDLIGRSRRDKRIQRETEEERARILAEEDRKKKDAESQSQSARDQFAKTEERRRARVQKYIQRAHELREKQGYKPGAGKGVRRIQDALKRAEANKTPSPAPTEPQDAQERQEVVKQPGQPKTPSRTKFERNNRMQPRRLQQSSTEKRLEETKRPAPSRSKARDGRHTPDIEKLKRQVENKPSQDRGPENDQDDPDFDP